MNSTALNNIMDSKKARNIVTQAATPSKKLSIVSRIQVLDLKTPFGRGGCWVYLMTAF